MTTTTALMAQDYRPAPTLPYAGVLGVVRSEHSVDASVEITADDDIIRMCKLPADHVPVDVIVDAGALDAATAAVFDVGIEDTVGATSDQDCFIVGSTAAQAGGVARAAAVAGFTIAPVGYDRFISVKFTTAPGTDQDGVLGLTLLYRAALRDD